MLLSEHVYCMAITFKMTEQVEQQICIRFCIKLEHSSTETISMIHKTTAMGNWWLAASSQQCACSCIMSHADFLLKHQITQVTQAPYIPDLVPWNFWLFPKLKSPLKEISDHEIQENMTGSWWWLGELCEGPRCLLWMRLRHHCVMHNVSCIFFNKCLYF